MYLFASKKFAVVHSTVSRITRELEKIRIEVDSKLSAEYQNNAEVRRSLQVLTYTPEFKVLTQDQQYFFPHLSGSKLNFNLINAIQHTQDYFAPSLRLISNTPQNKYFLTANNLSDLPSYRLGSDLAFDAVFFLNLDHPQNPLALKPIKTYVLAQGNGGTVKMGFRNNLLDENPENRFVEFSVPRFFSSTYKQEYEAVIEDSYGICMRTKDTSHIRIVFKQDKGELKLFDIHDSERSYEPRYFFMGYHLVDNVFDYLRWAMQLATKTRKNPLVQARINQGMISNDELVPVGR